jgi:hypothetical protein
MDEEQLDNLIAGVQELKSVLKNSPSLNKLEKKLLKMKKDNNLDIATMDYTGKMINAFDDYKYFQKMASRDY